MGVSGISLYQQDQNYWSQAQAQSAASSADDLLINVIGTAMTDEAKGEASIANGIALKRVNSELTAAVQAALQGSSSTSSSSNSSTGSSSSNSSSSGSSSSANSAGPSPATGTGTVPLTTGTSLSTLGILPGGQISISAGANLTTYTSTGTDTVGDLIDAINVDLPTNAQVTATLNNRGQLVITSRNTKDTFVVTGIYAGNIGFGPTNSTFEPVAPASSASTNATTASTKSAAQSTTTSSTASSTSGSSKSKSSTTVSSPLQQSVSTAAGILSADGVSGSLVDMLV